MIGINAYIGMAIMIFCGLLIPLAVSVWWIKTRKEKVTTVLLGAATWFVFVVILESIPKAILFNPAFSVGKAITENAALYTACGALMAGIFEETGRFIVFKTLLRKRTNRETGVSHGIGHGGMEAVFALLVVGVQNVIFSILIRIGLLQQIIERSVASGVDVSSLQALPEQLAAITPGAACLSAAERIFAMLLHVGLSVLVFYAVKKAKPQLYVLAILAHAAFDVPPALYQVGVLRSLYACEALIACFAVVFFTAIYRLLYRKDTPQMQIEADADCPQVESC